MHFLNSVGNWVAQIYLKMEEQKKRVFLITTLKKLDNKIKLDKQ